jgi:hypothetical protein
MATLPNNIFESYEAVLVGDWGCKVSKMNNQVMVFMWHMYNLDSQIEWFDSEYDAVLWMEYMSAKYV